jgi:hypothetical protein
VKEPIATFSISASKRFLAALSQSLRLGGAGIFKPDESVVEEGRRSGAVREELSGPCVLGFFDPSWKELSIRAMQNPLVY